MIEIISTYNDIDSEELKEILELPKNVRQIGEQISNKKIYIEDYVYTYLYHFAASDLDNPVVAILLGRYERHLDDKVLFVSGAIRAKYYLNDVSGLVMTNETWGYIYDEIKEYFNGYEVVGWFVSRPGFSTEINEQITRLHMSNFTGQDKVLYVIDPIEKEDGFYLYEGNQLRKQKGYYVYYERNEIMQNYMLENRVQEEKIAEEQDEVIKNFRRVVQSKKQETYQRKIINMLYATSTALAIIVLVIGIALLNNYDKMKSLEDTIHKISAGINNSEGINNDKLNQKVEEVINQDPVGSLEVEVKEGNISPITNTENEPVVEPIKDTKPTDVVEQAPPTSEKKYYVVKKGDTLDSISWKVYKNRAMTKVIQSLNGISNADRIIEGQKLLLP